MTFRLAVTGLKGQVARALIERAPKDVEITALGRPQLDLARRNAVLANLRHARCDAIINAAAYTAVDRAEHEAEVALRINGEGAAHVAEAAAALKVPLLHLSTDYVFDGALGRPYREDDEPRPTGAYGRSKLEGERRIAAVHDNHAILRLSWVYSPFGDNFVTAMLDRGKTRSDIAVVNDQFGNPTNACDVADALIVSARRLAQDASPDLRGLFHLASPDDASWADLAEAALALAEQYGRPPVRVTRVSSAEFPTLAPRLVNARMDTRKLATCFGLRLPSWRVSLTDCVRRIVAEND